MTSACPANDKRPFTIGLTGGIGSGKSAVADLLADFGASVIDTDVIARELTGPNGAAIAKIAEEFGHTVVGADGALDRAIMRSIVFSDLAAKSRLETILHPAIHQRAQAQLRSAQGPYAVLVVPLLQETERYRSLCDRILVVDCSEALQISRVVARSGLTPEEVRKIIATQASREERRAIASDVIDNSGDFLNLSQNVKILHERYLKAAQRRACGDVI